MENTKISPEYYNNNECLLAIKGATKGKYGVEAFIVGNIIKYLWRYEAKNGIEDVQKAKKYIEMLIDELSDLNNNSMFKEAAYFYDLPKENIESSLKFFSTLSKKIFISNYQAKDKNYYFYIPDMAHLKIVYMKEEDIERIKFNAL